MGSPYRRHRFPPEIISHAVWLYHPFTLSFHNIEDLLAERGITVSYEAIRSWRRKFGTAYASTLRLPVTSCKGGLPWCIKALRKKRLAAFLSVARDQEIEDVSILAHGRLRNDAKLAATNTASIRAGESRGKDDNLRPINQIGVSGNHHVQFPCLKWFS